MADGKHFPIGNAIKEEINEENFSKLFDTIFILINEFIIHQNKIIILKNILIKIKIKMRIELFCIFVKVYGNLI